MKTILMLCISCAAAAGTTSLPVAFEPNRGQIPAGFDYAARAKDFAAGLHSTGAEIAAGRARLTITLAGAKSAARPYAEEQLPGVSHYYRFDAPARAIYGIPTYSRVRYREVYAGIDIVYYGREGQLEFDFVAAPGSDPRRIRIRYQGARSLHLNAAGDLLIETPGGTMRQHRPAIYQERAGKRREVAGGYRLEGRTVRFEFGAYDHAAPLIIDPALAWSTYYGSTGTDTTESMATDSSGNIYVTGRTPAGNGYSDAYIAKLNPAGTTVLYKASLAGSYDDVGQAIKADSAGNAYVVGETDSATVFGSLAPHAFLAKLDSSGKVLYSPAFGGSGAEIAYAVALDSSSNVYIAGGTTSRDFPVSSGVAQTTLGGGADGFVTKIDSSGNLAASTFLGGNSDDYAFGIGVDSAGNVFVTGQTASSNFPVTLSAYQPRIAGGRDAFVTKLSPSLTLVYSTYLGGGADDAGNAIAVDTSGAAYVTGQTASANFPAAGALQTALGGTSDLFITKINADGAALAYSTYLGGGGDDAAYGIALDAAANAYITGYTTSTDFPVKDPFQPQNQGKANGVVAAVAANGASLLFSSYLGGNGSGGSTGDLGNAIVASCSAGLVVAGTTSSSNLPGTSGAYQGGASDGFIAKIGLLGTPAINSGGVVNAATSSSAPVAPGSLISIYGTGLALSTEQASALPLPTTLGGGASVTINGTAAPIVFASPGQINVQVPFEANAGTASAIVKTACGESAGAAFQVAAASPYIFSIGNDVAAARNQDNSINGPNNPARAGSVITVYLTGIGPLDNPVPTGASTPASPFSRATLPNHATIGGWDSGVAFLGLTPGFAGLAQANLVVPSLSPGAYPVVITIGGVESNGPMVYVQ